MAEFGQCGSFPFLVLSDVLGQLDGGEASRQGGEEAAGVDLGELAMVADQDELPGGSFDQVGDLGELAAADHACLVDYDDGPGWEATGCLGFPHEAGDGGGGDAGGGFESGGGSGGR